MHLSMASQKIGTASVSEFKQPPCVCCFGCLSSNAFVGMCQHMMPATAGRSCHTAHAMMRCSETDENSTSIYARAYRCRQMQHDVTCQTTLRASAFRAVAVAIMQALKCPDTVSHATYRHVVSDNAIRHVLHAVFQASVCFQLTEAACATRQWLCTCFLFVHLLHTRLQV